MPLVVGLIAFAIYTANTLTDLDEDAINRPDQASFVRRNARLFAALSVFGYACALGIAWRFGGVLGVATALAPGIVAALYSCSPSRLPLPRLKDVLGINTLAVALAWTVVLVGLPIAFGLDASGRQLGFAFVFLLLRNALSVELFNVTDVEGDRASGVSTVPVRFGIERAKWVFYAIDLVSISLLLVGWLYGVLPLTFVLVVVPLCCGSICLTSSLETVSMRYVRPAKDAEYLSLGVLALLFV
jgi:4-hydroxybenzoate polyprenyltransferase